MTEILANFSMIPLVNLSPWGSSDPAARAALADRVRDICHHVGFISPLTKSVLDELGEV